MTQQYDIVIVGGGLVGATLAAALKKSSLKIAVLECNQPKSEKLKEPIDDRAIVLSKASHNILNTLNLWPNFENYSTPITNIHVSNKGRLGSVRLSAKEHNVDALGYVVSAQHLYQGLQKTLSDVDVFYGARFEKIERVDGGAIVHFDCGGAKKITTALVVAADGTQSAVRKQQYIETTIHDYKQKAIICNIQLQQEHEGCAYERFTSDGPCAILPNVDNVCSVIWVTKPDESERLISLSNKDFLTALQKHFGYRLGKFIDVNKPVAFPLSFARAKQLVKENIVLIGNASQTLHPIAGQGLNLGLRDVAALAEIILSSEENLNDISLLNDYVSWRKFDHRYIMSLTHVLVTLFSNDFLPVNVGTTTGMMLMERLPKMRSMFAETSMGFVGKLPKLACGIEL